MPRSCSVCGHEDALAINEALVLEKASNRRIAAQYELSEQAIRRHRQHIPELLVKAREAEEAASAEDLLAELGEIRSHLRSLVSLAARDGKYGAAIAGENVLLKRVELLARVRKLLDERPQEVHIHISPQVQQLIVGALAPYPAARLAVADALGQLEEGAGSEAS